MRSDSYTKVVPAVIAVCLTALTLTAIGLPDPTTRAEATVSSQRATELRGARKPGDDPSEVRAPAATLPLRWKVSWAVEESSGSSTTLCGTAVVVTNDTNSTVNVEIEWFEWFSAPAGLASLTLFGARQKIGITGGPRSGPDTDYDPFIPDFTTDVTDFIGYARVHADDPRIQVAAFQYCRDGLGAGKNIMSITQIPVYPVGATMEYFQAGMPATWTPPMAAPEVPE